jgi:hypothetical protein
VSALRNNSKPGRSLVAPAVSLWTLAAVEDVDIGARRVRVRRSITQVGGRLVEGNPKSDAGRRSVPIPKVWWLP